MLLSKTVFIAITACVLSVIGVVAPGAAIAQDESAAALEEIVVTARKREENLQSVPVAVSVLSGNSLNQRGAMKLDVIGKIAPNVHFEAAQPTSGVKAPVVFIRGMGQDDFIIVEDPAVGVYIDGVYVGRTIGSAVDLVDIDRIEVMRGPQGTLFGRNTIGGAVNIVSRQPATDTYSGTGQLTIGDDQHVEGRLSLNVPMGDNFGGRFTGFVRQRDGYVNALQYDDLKLGDDDIWGVRALIAGNPTETFSFAVSADYTQSRETPGAIAPIDGQLAVKDGVLESGPGNPGAFGNLWNAAFSGDLACTTAAGQASNQACFGPVWNPGDPYSTNSVFADSDGSKIDPEQEVDVLGANVTMTWDFGGLTLKSITAYRDFDISLVNDLDFSPHIIFANNHPEFSQDQISQELQLTGTAKDDRLTYVLGAYFFQEEGVEDIFNQISHPISSGPPEFFFQTLRRFIDNDSLAAFGQFTFDISDVLHLTAGARYTRSDKTFDLETIRVATTNLQSGSLSQTEFTPMLTLAWDLAGDVMTYFTYSEGFRDGGYPARFTGAVPDPLPNYEAEFVKNYEIGLKSKLADNRVRLNIALFSMDYDDMQISGTSPTGGIGDNTTKFNLGSATIRGAEIELSAAATERLTLGANIGYLDDEIDELAGGSLVSSGVTIETDHDLPHTPNLTLALSANYELLLGSGAAILFRGDWSYKDDYYTRLENIIETLETNHQSLDLSARYISADGAWEVGIGARNATDEFYYQARRIFNGLDSVYGSPVRPRTIYATLKRDFGE